MDHPEEEAPVFFLEQKIKVNKTGAYRFKGGKSLNINIGSSFNLNHSKSHAFGQSVNFLEPLGGIPFVGKVFGSLGIRYSRDESKARSDSTSISEQAFLVMQQATMDVELLDYERCTLIRPNPEIVLRHLLSTAPLLYHNKKVHNKVVSQMVRGYMICEGKNLTKPRAVRERYYYFTQHFTEGDQLDSNDIYNHPWLLALRGVRDFKTFVGLLYGAPTSWDFKKVVKEEAWALQQLMKTYREIHPTFPGLYTILPDEEDKPEYPFDDKPSDSFQNSHKSRARFSKE